MWKHTVKLVTAAGEDVSDVDPWLLDLRKLAIYKK